jgi:hypothetical protein
MINGTLMKGIEGLQALAFDVRSRGDDRRAARGGKQWRARIADRRWVMLRSP